MKIPALGANSTNVIICGPKLTAQNEGVGPEGEIPRGEGGGRESVRWMGRRSRWRSPFARKWAAEGGPRS